MNTTKPARVALSLLELLAVLTVIGIVTAVTLPRVFDSNEAANIAACYVNKGDIEVQVELWRHNTGELPKDSLADIGAVADYFPDGLPTCPVDSTPYTIDNVTGHVIGHNH